MLEAMMIWQLISAALYVSLVIVLWRTYRTSVQPGTIVWALHYIVAPLIEVADDGRTATGSWYLLEPCTIATEAGPRAMLISGRYADRYRLEPDGWKFS